MICLHCDSEEFGTKPDAELEQEFRGETLKVVSPAMVCRKCGWMTVALDQVDELSRRTADAYRKRHGLLTSIEIRDRRKVLGMNQPEFAKFLRVGEASVKRWETWKVQDPSSDELIRLKCGLAEMVGVHALECLGSLTAPALRDAVQRGFWQDLESSFLRYLVRASWAELTTEFQFSGQGPGRPFPFRGMQAFLWAEHSPTSSTVEVVHGVPRRPALDSIGGGRGPWSQAHPVSAAPPVPCSERPARKISEDDPTLPIAA